MFSAPDFKLHHIAFSLKTSDSIIGHQRISQGSESKNQVESINHGGNQETNNSQRIIINSFYITKASRRPVLSIGISEAKLIWRVWGGRF